MAVTNLLQIAYHLKDVPQGVAFFRDALGVPFLFEAGPDLAFFDLGGVRLMLSTAPAGSAGGNSTLYLKVDNLDQVFEAKQGLLDFVDEPHLIAKMPDHELWMVFFKDPEGNQLAFAEERR